MKSFCVSINPLQKFLCVNKSPSKVFVCSAQISALPCWLIFLTLYLKSSPFKAGLPDSSSNFESKRRHICFGKTQIRRVNEKQTLLDEIITSRKHFKAINLACRKITAKGSDLEKVSMSASLLKLG